MTSFSTVSFRTR